MIFLFTCQGWSGFIRASRIPRRRYARRPPDHPLPNLRRGHLWRCRFLLHDDAEAEDATHETFLRVRGHLHRVATVREAVFFIYRVATNYCLTQLRSRKHRPAPTEDPEAAARGRAGRRRGAAGGPGPGPAAGGGLLCGGTGSYLGSPDPVMGVYLAKFSGIGELLWNASATLASSEQESCEAVTVLDDGDIIFGGLHGYGASRALLTGKVDGATGAKKWWRTFHLTDRTNLSSDVAIALHRRRSRRCKRRCGLRGNFVREINLGANVGTLAARGSAICKRCRATRSS